MRKKSIHYQIEKYSTSYRVINGKNVYDGWKDLGFEIEVKKTAVAIARIQKHSKWDRVRVIKVTTVQEVVFVTTKSTRV